MFNIRNKEQLDSYAKRNNFEINLQGPSGLTILHISTINNNYDLVKTLLEKKADINLLDANGKSAVIYIKDEKMLKIYLDILGPSIFDYSGKSVACKFSTFLKGL